MLNIRRQFEIQDFETVAALSFVGYNKKVYYGQSAVTIIDITTGV